MFRITKKSRKSAARTGVLTTAHGAIRSPFFMPIATKGALKTLTSFDAVALGAQILLSNTYHLMVRPGVARLKKYGGLHSFMKWQGPLLTDSGGYQVFSLAKLRRITPHGVKFQSHIDGTSFFLSPKNALEVQEAIGSDIRMLLDICPSHGCSRKEAEEAVATTTVWAKESKKFIRQKKNNKALFFAIVQGSRFIDLRTKSAAELIAIDFDGYALGGLAVGESEKELYEVLNVAAPLLPEKKPRYLMGVGYPEQIVHAVKQGVDMFDCVIPTREARHGKLYLWKNNSIDVIGKPASKWYETIQLTNARFATNTTPINPHSRIPELQEYTKAYLHHLFKTQEPLALRLATLNNVEFYITLMQKIHTAIRAYMI